MAKRKFDQYCPMAHGLPGIGTNILASRLRDLEECGVVEKRKLPPPAASTVYELTDYGTELREAMYAIARWGARTLGPPTAEDELYPEWGMNALPALFNAAEARGLTETYVFNVRIVDGSLEATIGDAEDADLVVEMGMDTFFALATGEVELRDAAERGTARVEGDPDAIDRCFRVLSLAPRVGVPA